MIYYVGPAFLREGWSSMGSENVFDEIYVSGPFGFTGIALHSAILPLALLLLYFVPKIGRRDHRRIFLWFLIGWFGHAAADFLTHAANARPLFWPLSGWTWNSPISYYDPLHYGREFFLISHALMLLILVTLIIRRILDSRRKSPARIS